MFRPVVTPHIEWSVTGGHVAMTIRGIDKKPMGAGLRGGRHLAFLLGRKKSRDGGRAAFAVAAVFEIGGIG